MSNTHHAKFENYHIIFLGVISDYTSVAFNLSSSLHLYIFPIIAKWFYIKESLVILRKEQSRPYSNNKIDIWQGSYVNVLKWRMFFRRCNCGWLLGCKPSLLESRPPTSHALLSQWTIRGLLQERQNVGQNGWGYWPYCFSWSGNDQTCWVRVAIFRCAMALS